LGANAAFKFDLVAEVVKDILNETIYMASMADLVFQRLNFLVIILIFIVLTRRVLFFHMTPELLLKFQDIVKRHYH
jgi:hypothetical protein